MFDVAHALKMILAFTQVDAGGDKAGVITEFLLVGLRAQVRRYKESLMTDDTTVYPTGLTEAQALEINDGLKWGSRLFFVIALAAHVMAYTLSPWFG